MGDIVPGRKPGEPVPQRPRCAPGTHDFHTGKAPCTRCGLLARDVVQSGGRVVGPGAENDDGWRPQEVVMGFDLGAPWTPDDIQNAGITMLISSPQDLGEKIDRIRKLDVRGPSLEKVEDILFGGLTEEQARYLGAREVVGVDDDCIVPMPPHVGLPEYNRMDEVAKPYGLVRRPGEDDDSLATRIRRYVSTHPGSYVTPPPMDWQPPKRGQKPIPGARRGPIIDVEPEPPAPPARRPCEPASAHAFRQPDLVCARCGFSAQDLARRHGERYGMDGVDILRAGINSVSEPNTEGDYEMPGTFRTGDLKPAR